MMKEFTLSLLFIVSLIYFNSFSDEKTPGSREKDEDMTENIKRLLSVRVLVF